MGNKILQWIKNLWRKEKVMEFSFKNMEDAREIPEISCGIREHSLPEHCKCGKELKARGIIVVGSFPIRSVFLHLTCDVCKTEQKFLWQNGDWSDQSSFDKMFEYIASDY